MRSLSIFAQYCESTATESGGEFISKVVVNDFVNVSEGAGYSDFTGLKPIALYAQGNYKFSVDIQDYYKGNNVVCWIDLNCDEVFDDYSEIFFAKQLQVGENYAIASFEISIPDAIVEGKSRMRIILSSEKDVTACMTYEYGETEDYCVELKKPTKAPIANFKAGTSVVFVKSSLSFINQTDGFAKNYEWSFAPSTVTYLQGTDKYSKNPVVRFEEQGFYSVTLKASNQVGSTQKIIDNYIDVKNFEVPKGLSATTEGDQVFLDWQNPINESWECYSDFSLSLAPWTQLDFDNAYTVGFNGVTFPNQNYVGTAIVLNPSATSSDISSVIPVHSGQKCLAIFRALQTSNNDWIVSPKVHLGEKHQFSFWARSITDKYTLERFNVGVSLKGNSNPEDFMMLTPEPVETTTEWTLYSYDLSAFASNDAYVAIQCVTNSGFALLLDDFIISDYESAEKFNKTFNQETLENVPYTIDADPQVVNTVFKKEGFTRANKYLAQTEVYRDDERIKILDNSLLTKYIDNNVPDGPHSYYVKSKYINPEGASNKSNIVSVNVDNKSAEVEISLNKDVISTGDVYRVPGCTASGQTRELTLVIKNKGTKEDLIISNFNLSESEYFKLKQQPNSLVKPGESTTAIVEFAPTVNGYQTINISFDTNDKNESQYNFSLKTTTGDEWTWMFYLYEDGTQLDGAKDFNEWEVLGSIEEKVNYLVLYDAYDDSQDGIYYVTKDPNGQNSVLVSEKISNHMGTDFDMNKSETLQEFILWSQKRYPANHYGITVWDHGSGIFKNKEDLITKGCIGNMKLWELDDALAAFKAQARQNVDIFGFDLCLLGQVETAYQLKDYVDYVVFSEKTEPGDGWHYSTAFKMMNENPQVSPRDFAINLVDCYFESYNNGLAQQGPMGTTQSAVANDVLVAELLPVLNQFSETFAKYYYEYASQFRKTISQAWFSDNRPEHIDLGHLGNLIAKDANYPEELRLVAQKLVEAVNKAVIRNRYTMPVNSNTTGMKIWLPGKISESSNLDFYINEEYLIFHESKWDELLFVIDNPVEPDNPRIEFEASKMKILAGETVTFENTSVAIPFINSYHWELPNDDCEFVEGTDRQSRMPIVRFDQPGDYAVKIVVNNGGEDMEYTKVISVTEPVFMAPGNLTGVGQEQSVLLKWFAPGETMTLNEGFEGATFPPAGWESYVSKDMTGENFQTPDPNGGRWFKVNVNSFQSVHPEYIHSGDYSAGISYVAPDFNWLITPELSIGDEEDLYYWTWYKNGANDDGNMFYTKIHVLVLDEGAWHEELLWYKEQPSNFFEQEVKVELDKYEGKNIRIAFVYEYTDGFQMMIDDVTIHGADAEYGASQGNTSSGDLAGYNVYRDGTFLSATEAATFVDENLPSGTYVYDVTAFYVNPEGESEHSTSVEVAVGATGIEDMRVNEFSLYPNPSRDFLTIKCEVSAKIAVYNLNGQLKLSIIADSQINKFDISGFEPGVYIVQVLMDGEYHTQKIVVE